MVVAEMTRLEGSWWTEAGTHAVMQGWIPACAEERHSYCREILVRSTPRLGQKGSGGMTERKAGMTTFYNMQSGREFAAALFIPEVLGLGL
jgi:hypothetical protein